MRTQGIVCAAAALFAFAPPAQATIYQCTIPATAQRGWIPEVLVIDYDGTSATAVVNDPIILQFVGEPIPAKVQKSAQSVVFSWALKDFQLPRTKQRVRIFDFRAVLDPKTLAIKVTGRPDPSEYTNVFVGRGACKAR